jgi:signal transduction histidine kinase
MLSIAQIQRAITPTLFHSHCGWPLVMAEIISATTPHPHHRALAYSRKSWFIEFLPPLMQLLGMLRVIGCITDQHDLRLVVLAGLICTFACYTSLGLLARAQAAQHGKLFAWLSGAAVVFGAGVWATHFVAELAYSPGIPTGYGVGLTALSIVIAVTMSWLGFAAALFRHAPAQGGATVGASIGSMHYVGMAALTAPANVQWDAVFVLGSLIIGIVFGALALWVNGRSSDIRHRAAGASLLVLAICGLHFTAMAAVTLVPNPSIAMSAKVLDPEWMAVAIAAVTVLIIALGLFGSVVDQRLAERAEREAERLRIHITKLEITQAKLESTTRDLETALEEAARASQAKSQFLAAMSHELRTPLNAVIGFAEMLAQEMFGPLGSQRYRDYAGAIQSSGGHLLGLINDILDLSKLDAGALELDEQAVDLNAMARESVRMLATQAGEARVRLDDQLQSGLPLMQADARRVRQIVLNLLANAIKFTPPQGEVCISTFRCEAGIALAVRDTGIGIAPEDISKALERFGQIDNGLARKYEGTGLGLPLSKHLAELHGGSLQLESQVGHGTTVTVTFPSDRLLGERAAA